MDKSIIDIIKNSPNPTIALLTAIIGSIASIIKTFFPIRKHYYELRNDYEQKIAEHFKKVYSPLALALKSTSTYVFLSANNAENDNLKILNDYSYILNPNIFKDLHELYILEKTISTNPTHIFTQEHAFLKEKILLSIYSVMNQHYTIYDSISNTLQDKFCISFETKTISFFQKLFKYSFILTALSFSYYIVVGFIIALIKLDSTAPYIFLKVSIVTITICTFLYYYIKLVFFSNTKPILDPPQIGKYVNQSGWYTCRACNTAHNLIAHSRFPNCSNYNRNIYSRLKHWLLNKFGLLWRTPN
jgi:hypothetical protein